MVKVAVAGCGLIAVKKHIPAFLRLKPKVELVAICDLNEDVLKRVAGSFNIRKSYTNFSDMFLKESPDIVDICTPPKTHADLTIQALEKGAHVFLEKPMALKVPDCDSMIETASRFKKKICVIHNQIFNPAFMKARELIVKGEIGDFLGIHIFLSTPFDYMTSKKDHWAHQLPGGVLGETGPHAVYLALAFLKNIHGVEIQAKKLLPEYPWSNFEDFRINLLAENAIGSATLVYASNQWAANIDILGTKGMIKIDLQAQLVTKYKRAYLSPTNIGLSVLSETQQTLKSLCINSLRHIFGKRKDAHQIGIHHFVDSILNDKPLQVSATDARETVRVMEMITQELKCAES